MLLESRRHAEEKCTKVECLQEKADIHAWTHPIQINVSTSTQTKKITSANKLKKSADKLKRLRQRFNTTRHKVEINTDESRSFLDGSRLYPNQVSVEQAEFTKCNESLILLRQDFTQFQQSVTLLDDTSSNGSADVPTPEIGNESLQAVVDAMHEQEKLRLGVLQGKHKRIVGELNLRVASLVEDLTTTLSERDQLDQKNTTLKLANSSKQQKLNP